MILGKKACLALMEVENGHWMNDESMKFPQKTISPETIQAHHFGRLMAASLCMRTMRNHQ